MVRKCIVAAALILSIGSAFALAEMKLHPRCPYCGSETWTEQISGDDEWSDVRHHCKKCKAIRNERLRVYSWNSW